VGVRRYEPAFAGEQNRAFVVVVAEEIPEAAVQRVGGPPQEREGRHGGGAPEALLQAAREPVRAQLERAERRPEAHDVVRQDGAREAVAVEAQFADAHEQAQRLKKKKQNMYI
jgi:hypothetical protein